MSVRVRYAPSPTGQVHIGNIRAAIFNWLYARHHGGKFLLRVEDTDRERSTPEALKTVLDSLEWLGLNFDEPPVYQLDLRAAHLAAAEALLKSGAAYREDKGGTGKGEAVVFRMPATDMEFHDEIKGLLRKEAKDTKDFVIVRSDGSPVFHLGNVVDDIQMRITHVIRGDDHIENTYRHVALYRALGADVPKFAHLPMIVNAQGKPYSKRDGDAYVGDFKSRGFLPYALVNYLALLGWSPGDDREKMSREELISAFDLDRVESSAAQMDLRKLTDLNGQYMAELPAAEFIETAREWAGAQDWAAQAEPSEFAKVCATMQSRTKTFADISGWGYFFGDIPAYDEKACAKQFKDKLVQGALTQLAGELEKVPAGEFRAATIESIIHTITTANGIAQGKLNQPVRVAVTGTTIGAGIYETMELLGKPRVQRRLQHALGLMAKLGA